MGSKILVVEDEKDLRDLMCLHLKREGYDVDDLGDGDEAENKIKTNPYDLLIFDWMLPGLSGLELAKKIKNHPEQFALLKDGYQILMVTARAETSDIVLGLDSGADDYITKPFENSIFLARVRTLLRRSGQPKKLNESQILKVGSLKMDFVRHEVFCGEEEIKLTHSEFKLLQALLSNRGAVMTRARLITLVQGDDVSVIDRTVDTHVFGLRKKLGACGELIDTIRGVGYRINS